MRKNAILDTNIFLHYDILSVDWCKELESDEVEIVVCPTVLKELDKKKYDENQTIVKRAIRNLSLIESYNASKKEIRKNVKISVIVKEPKIDWDRFSLDSTLNDDRILGFIKERENSLDVLITNDSTPRIKGKELGIPIRKLSCDMLPNIKNEAQKELEKTQKELQRLQNKIPDLFLRLISSETSKDGLPKYSIKKIHDLSEKEIELIVNERKQELDINFTSPQFLIPSLKIDELSYKKDVKNYLELYRKYIIDKNPIDKELSTILKMTFVISCDIAPAEDVYCEIGFPKNFNLLEETDLPLPPSEPVKPKPKTFLERSFVGLNLGNIPLLNSSLFNLPTHISEKNVSVNIDSNKIQSTIKKINHGFKIELCTTYVKLPSLEFAKNFEVTYSIHASNLVEPIRKKIPIIIEKFD